MKTTKIILVTLVLIAINQFAYAQCGNNKVALHICINNKCYKVCVLSSQVPSYQAMGYALGGCTGNTFCGGLFRAADESSETTISEIYPNPVSPETSGSTTISFFLSQSQNVSLKILDVNGRLVSTLADKIFETGENEIMWKVAEVNSGVYFLQIQSLENLETKKLIVTK